MFLPAKILDCNVSQYILPPADSFLSHYIYLSVSLIDYYALISLSHYGKGLQCLLSLFLFLFFTAMRDFHTADSWTTSFEWNSEPEKSTWEISD